MSILIKREMPKGCWMCPFAVGKHYECLLPKNLITGDLLHDRQTAHSSPSRLRTGYDGESRNAKVYRTNLPGFEAVRLIKVGKGLHYIEEDHEVLEKATGEYHKRASWLVDIERA